MSRYRWFRAKNSEFTCEKMYASYKMLMQGNFGNSSYKTLAKKQSDSDESKNCCCTRRMMVFEYLIHYSVLKSYYRITLFFISHRNLIIVMAALTEKVNCFWKAKGKIPSKTSLRFDKIKFYRDNEIILEKLENVLLNKENLFFH